MAQTHKVHIRPCESKAMKDNYHNLPNNIALHEPLLWSILLFLMFLLKSLKYVVIQLNKY